MHNISMTRALDVWSDLCDAQYGKASHGTVAEIYLYRLMPDSPYVALAREPGKPLTGMAAEKQAARVKNANRSLYAILAMFAEMRACAVYVNARPLGPWVMEEGYDWRVMVRVETRP